MYLFINNLGEEIFLALFILKGLTLKYLAKTNLSKKHNHSENILKGVDKLLNKVNKKPENLKGIIVVNGPGAFTGIRVALSVANTLAWSLKIPVVGISLVQTKDNNRLIQYGIEKLTTAKPGDLAKPFYGKEPNITRPKP